MNGCQYILSIDCFPQGCSSHVLVVPRLTTIDCETYLTTQAAVQEWPFLGSRFYPLWRMVLDVLKVELKTQTYVFERFVGLRSS